MIEIQHGRLSAASVSSTIRSDAGQVVLTDVVERSSDDLKTARGVSTRIPLKALRPGLYVLTVETRSELGNAEPVSRLLQFRVR